MKTNRQRVRRGAAAPGRNLAGGFTLVSALALALVLSAPATLAAATLDGPDAVAAAGSIKVPKGYPDSDKVFEPTDKGNQFRAYYATSGGKTWDYLSSSKSLSKATGAAKRVLNNSQYSHAFIKDKSSGKIVWTSW